MKLLVVEDNERLVERIRRQLGAHYLIDAVSSGVEALEKTSAINYAVILLDLGLPDMNGLDVCKQLRKNNILTPILIVTGTNTVESRVDLLSAGADDYISKPFNADELRARIAALSRRQPITQNTTQIKYLDLVIDSEKRQVYRGGKPIDLRRKEFDILEYLVANKGRVLTREMIINHAWDSSHSSWHSTVDVHIKHLRDKIDKPFKKKLIKTAYGLGYKVDVPEN